MRHSLLPALLLLLCSTITLAQDPELQKEVPEAEDAKALVETTLIQPVVERDKNEVVFGRGAQPRRGFRTATFDANVSHDATGAPFFAYAKESKYGRGKNGIWRADVTGCAYPETREVLVRFGKKFYPANRMLGKSSPAAPQTA